ncbi:FAD-dependent oxidoreductase [Bradyrhizobium tropiciagri]|uniref:NAD(P)/FAD-dependent oxidoreductase n=1 Tax=Bradyrhizobium tropiciagri TaxID=312253 RepID=UPI001BA90D9F|nr:FAD-dependent oxidoreductase [Bradyrhizobium tropiciagri]MBR0899047.1 FAD-dependent oxidoreductase [Bradyrhizobium tropiciagri]
MRCADAGVVIVGGGQAGSRAAEALRLAEFRGSITLVGDEVHLPYERPQLSKELLLKEEAGPAYIRSREQWQELDVDVMTGVRVAGCDLERRVLGFEDGRERPFTKLLIATGTRARRLPDLEQGPIPVFYLRSVDDAVGLRASLREGLRVALIGGGVIGLEVAAAAVERGCAVTVIEAAPLVLAQVGSRLISEYFLKLHRDLGVRVLTEVTAQRVAPEGLVLSDGSICPADLVLVGIGVEPAVESVAGSGISTSKGIRVDRHGATECDGVYAAGDVAEQWNRCADRWMRVENWANAQNQAVSTAKSMLGQGEGYDSVPWFWSDQHKTNLQVVGSLSNVTEIVRGDSSCGRFSVLGLRDDEIVGAATVNAPKHMAILRRAVAARMRVNRADLENPEFDLKRLLSK